MTQGIQMAVDEVNAAGGVLGKQIELVFEDAGATADSSINPANKICANDELTAIIGPQYSSQAIATGDIFEAAEIPHIVGATGPTVPVQVKDPYMIRVRTSDSLAAKICAQYMEENFDTTKVGIMYCTDDFGVGAMEVATAYFDEVGIDYIAEGHGVDDKDMTAQILKLKNAGVTSILLWTLDNSMAVCARQIYELGLADLEILCSPSLSVQTVLDQLEPEWTNGWYVQTHFTLTSSEPEVQEFIAKYTEKFGGAPDLVSAAYYGGTLFLLDSIEKAGSTENTAILEAIKAADGSFKSVVGAYTYEDREMVHQVVICRNENNENIFVTTFGY